MSGPTKDNLARFERALMGQQAATYELTLFVTGASDLSARAIQNVRLICETHLSGRYQLDVVDVHRDAALMMAYDVVAAPTLIKTSPLPKRMLVGDLSNTARVLAALDIQAQPVPPRAVPG